MADVSTGSPSAQAESLLAAERSRFHAKLLADGILAVNAAGVASNADKDSKASRAYAGYIARALRSETVGERLAGQTAGGQFEQACADFLAGTFLQLGHLVREHGVCDASAVAVTPQGVAQYEQYSHLVSIRSGPSSRTRPCAPCSAMATPSPGIVSRSPMTDEEINRPGLIVDDSVATKVALRATVQTLPILHAVISCKWTLRTDRAQNARSEALNLIRNRKGRLPHVAVVTAEPTPARISSLALGTGDLDCVYHFALPELVAAVHADGGSDTPNSSTR